MIVRGFGLLAGMLMAAAPIEAPVPIALKPGMNPVADIAGDGESGIISRDWRENGNAWGYAIFMVRVGESIATIAGKDFITDQPHTGEDSIRAVRFARGRHGGRQTTLILVADRKIGDAVPDPAVTTVSIYALVANDEGLGTPYQFVEVETRTAKRRYCNADMALARELRLALPLDYDGVRSADGC